MTDPLLSVELADIIDRLDKIENCLGGRDSELSLPNLAETVAKISESVAELGELANAEQQDAAGPWWWPSLLRSEAEEAWEILTSWVDDVLRERYPPDAHDKVRACWFAHPGVVDELTALYFAWKGAYRPDAAHTAVFEWFDRALPNTLGRTREATRECPGGAVRCSTCAPRRSQPR